jgi:hypothetical protein
MEETGELKMSSPLLLNQRESQSQDQMRKPDWALAIGTQERRG